MVSALFAGLALLSLGSTPTVNRVAPKVLLLDLHTEVVAAPQVEVLQTFLAGALRDQGFRVVTRAEIADALDLQHRRKLLGCDDTGCMAELGGALGVMYMVRPSVAALDEKAAVALVLTDDRGNALAETRGLVRDRRSTSILAAFEGQVPKLVASVRPVASARTDDADAPPTLTRAPVSAAPDHTAAVVTWVIGGVLAAGAAVMTGLTIHGYGALGPNYLESDAQTVRTEAHVADALWAGALVAGGVGTVLYFTATPTPGGGGEISLGGTF